MTEERTISLSTDFGSIRDARLSDADNIVRLVAGLAAHHGDEAMLTARALTRDAFCDRPWLHILVAEDSGRELIGYAALSGFVRLQFGERGLEIHHLFTSKQFRGRGVGTALVDASRAKANALLCDYLAVGTAADNHYAQAFYEGFGFTRRSGTPSPRFLLKLARRGEDL